MVRLVLCCISIPNFISFLLSSFFRGSPQIDDIADNHGYDSGTFTHDEDNDYNYDTYDDNDFDPDNTCNLKGRRREIYLLLWSSGLLFFCFPVFFPCVYLCERCCGCSGCGGFGLVNAGGAEPRRANEVAQSISDNIIV